MIPPELFPPWLQVILYIYVFPTMVILGVIVVVLWWKLIVPKEARTLTWNRLFKSPLIGIATDDGFIDIERAKPFSEGCVTTRKGAPFFLPRSIENEFTEMVKESNPAPMGVESVALKRYILRGTGTPFYLAHASKALLVNPISLLGLKEDNKEGLVKLSGKLGKDLLVKFASSKFVKVLLPIDPTAIKKWFPALWNESQIDSYGMRKEKIGYERAKGELKRLMVPLIILLVAGIAIMFFIYLMSTTGGHVA